MIYVGIDNYSSVPYLQDIPGEVFTQKLVSNHTEAKVKVPNRTNSRKSSDFREYEQNSGNYSLDKCLDRNQAFSTKGFIF